MTVSTAASFGGVVWDNNTKCQTRVAQTANSQTSDLSEGGVKRRCTTRIAYTGALNSFTVTIKINTMFETLYKGFKYKTIPKKNLDGIREDIW